MIPVAVAALAVAASISAAPAEALAAVPSRCVRFDVRSVELPVRPDRVDGPTFEYRYQVRARSPDPSAPTLVFLPGGPGGTSMSFVPEHPAFDFVALSLGLPSRYRAILTDPRGRGCNDDPEQPLPRESFRTDYLASDVLAMIRREGLRDYVLVGHSYGSVLATQVAARAARGEAPAPRAVVLSGIVGRAFASDEQWNAFEREWAALRRRLAPAAASVFDRTLRELRDSPGQLLGLDRRDWVDYLGGQLTQGEVFVGGKIASSPVTETLDAAVAPDSRRRMAVAIAVAAAHREPDEYAQNRLFFPIACRELFDPSGDDCRASGETLDRPFDSAAWQIAAPIFYVQGENDPNTPPNQALYHYLHQTWPERWFVSVPRAGHPSLGALHECANGFWDAVYARGAGLAKALAGCTAHPRPLRPRNAP